jgi:hypothetical protein
VQVTSINHVDLHKGEVELTLATEVAWYDHNATYGKAPWNPNWQPKFTIAPSKTIEDLINVELRDDLNVRQQTKRSHRFSTKANDYLYESVPWDSTWYPFSTYKVWLVFQSSPSHRHYSFKSPIKDNKQWHKFPNDISKETLQRLLGYEFTATSGLQWEFTTPGPGSRVRFMAEFEFTRNVQDALVTDVVPILTCAILAYTSLLLPATNGMAMPRVGVTLLALVSISSLFQKVTGTSPPGVNWLKAMSLGIFVSALATVVAHSGF